MPNVIGTRNWISFSRGAGTLACSVGTHADAELWCESVSRCQNGLLRSLASLLELWKSRFNRGGSQAECRPRRVLRELAPQLLFRRGFILRDAYVEPVEA